MRQTIQALLLSLGLLALHAQAREVEGVKYNETLDLAGSSLQLNGAGTRYKAVFKVYTAGLYLSKKAVSTAEALAAPGPKRLTLTFISIPRNWAAFSSRASRPTRQTMNTRAWSVASCA